MGRAAPSGVCRTHGRTSRALRATAAAPNPSFCRQMGNGSAAPCRDSFQKRSDRRAYRADGAWPDHRRVCGTRCAVSSNRSLSIASSSRGTHGSPYRQRGQNGYSAASEGASRLRGSGRLQKRSVDHASHRRGPTSDSAILSELARCYCLHTARAQAACRGVDRQLTKPLACTAQWRKSANQMVKRPSPGRRATARLRRNRPLVGRGEPTGPTERHSAALRCRPDQQPVVAVLITV